MIATANETAAEKTRSFFSLFVGLVDAGEAVTCCGRVIVTVCLRVCCVAFRSSRVQPTVVDRGEEQWAGCAACVFFFPLRMAHRRAHSRCSAHLAMTPATATAAEPSGSSAPPVPPRSPLPPPSSSLRSSWRRPVRLCPSDPRWSAVSAAVSNLAFFRTLPPHLVRRMMAKMTMQHVPMENYGQTDDALGDHPAPAPLRCSAPPVDLPARVAEFPIACRDPSSLFRSLTLTLTLADAGCPCAPPPSPSQYTAWATSRRFWRS